jgi:hypothetical protein
MVEWNDVRRGIAEIITHSLEPIGVT